MLLAKLRVPYKILVASDEWHYIRLLRSAYGDRVVFYEAIRSESEDAPLHRSNEPSPWRIGRDAVIECLLLSKADYFFESHSNLSMAARCFHPEMAHSCFSYFAQAPARRDGRSRRVRALRYPGPAKNGAEASIAIADAQIRLGIQGSRVERCPCAWESDDLEHVIILPYYSVRELQTFQRLAGLWQRLPAGKIRYRFLISARFDAPALPRQLLNALSEVAPVAAFRCPSREVRFPDSASAMFYDTLEHVFRTAARDGGFVLWHEADMVPLRPNWLSDLDAEWKSGRYTLMGKLVNYPLIPEHINGGACYAKDFVRTVPRTGGAWDVSSFRFVRQFGFSRATNQIEFRYQCPTLAEPPAPGAVIMHGVKDLSVIDHVERTWL